MLVLSIRFFFSLFFPCHVSFFSQKQEVNEKEINSPLSRTGHLEGARIGIIAKPSAEFVAGLLGTWLCGGVAVPLALNYPEAELHHVMNDSVCPNSSIFFFSLLSFILLEYQK